MNSQDSPTSFPPQGPCAWRSLLRHRTFSLFCFPGLPLASLPLSLGPELKCHRIREGFSDLDKAHFSSVCLNDALCSSLEMLLTLAVSKEGRFMLFLPGETRSSVRAVSASPRSPLQPQLTLRVIDGEMVIIFAKPVKLSLLTPNRVCLPLLIAWLMKSACGDQKHIV